MSIAENSDIENWIAKETPETAIEPELHYRSSSSLVGFEKNNQMGFRQSLFIEEISTIFRIVDLP